MWRYTILLLTQWAGTLYGHEEENELRDPKTNRTAMERFREFYANHTRWMENLSEDFSDIKMGKPTGITAPMKEHAKLIQMLVEDGYMQNDVVRQTMLRVDRKYFVKKNVYDIFGEYIGYGSTFSPPQVQMFALEALENHLKRGSRALDVGCGTGYITACMGLMVGKPGLTFAMDHIIQLVRLAKRCVKRSNSILIRKKRVKFIKGDGRLGLPKYAPYDAIHVGASGTEVPEPLIQQLKLGGRLVMHLEPDMKKPGLKMHSLIVVDKHINGTIDQFIKESTFFSQNCEMLTDRESQLLAPWDQVPTGVPRIPSEEDYEP